MDSMVTKIRILRKKCHDIECIYVLEFLKLIGCLVFDRVFPNDLSSDINQAIPDDELNEKYDVNICYGIFGDKINGMGKTGFEYIEPENNEEQKINAENFLHLLVKRIWPDSNNPEDKAVCLIKDLYINENIFAYLYNKGNFKFIREYIPINSSDTLYSDKGNDKSIREDMCNRTYSKLFELYEKLYAKDFSEMQDSIYLKFVKINLAQDINEIRELMGNGKAFRTDYMLKTLNDILNVFPKMIRCYYLKGVICNLDNRNLLNSYSYYLAAEDEAKKDNLPETLLSLIYYQMGKCLEKRQIGKYTAYDAYFSAYKSNPYMMRALYKLAEIEYGRGGHEIAVKYCNEIIHVLLNGYPMDDAMPGQQLYAYNGLVLLGDIYQAEGRYELSIRCYRRAIDLAKIKSKFYKVWDDSASVSFEPVQKMCMPVQPIYFKIINCATMSNNLNQRAEYYEMLRNEYE